MRNTIKRILKRIPLASQMYTSWRSWRDVAEARHLFVNHELYLRALTKKGAGTVILRTRDGLNITIRQNIWDARIIKEQFLDKPYIRYFKFPNNPTIIDIGGYIGDFSLFAAQYLNAKHVIVYEPTVENFELLKRNVDNNAFGNRIAAINKAVSNSTEVTLNVEIQDSDEVQVSAYWFPEAEHRIIPSVTLSDVFAEHYLDSVDLLKIDCEGGEYDIFPNVTNEIFSRIRNIVFEYHPIDGYKEKLELVLSRLRSAGYIVQLEGSIAYAWRA
jgi:FkbM family methyltransferase